jgi:O-antigen/teichoic acid export membrane protein
MISPHVLIYLVSYMLPALIGFLALILYTHLLSPAEYGVYVIGASIAGIISGVFFSWVRLSVSRYQARSLDVDLRAEAIVAFGGMVVVIACLTPVAIFIVRPNVGFGIIAGSLLLSLSLTAFEISQEFRRARLNPVRFTIIAIMRSILGLTLGFCAVWLGGGGLGLLLAVGASFLITNLLGLQGSAAKPLRLRSVGQLTQFVRYGLPFSLGALAYALHGAVDRLGVAYLLGQSGAGYYGPAADMTRQLIGMLAASIGSAMFPLVFRSLAESGPVAARERLKEGMELLLALIAPVTVWFAISADVVAGTLLGVEFQTAVAALLPLLAFGRLCSAVNQFYLHISFQLAEKPLLQVTHDIAILGVNLALLFPLTLAFGLTGTAATILISEAVGVVLGILLSRKAFKLPFNGRGMLRVCAATAALALFTYAAKITSGGHGPLTLVTMMAAGGGAYACAAFLLDLAGIRSSVSALRWLRRGAVE